MMAVIDSMKGNFRNVKGTGVDFLFIHASNPHRIIRLRYHPCFSSRAAFVERRAFFAVSVFDAVIFELHKRVFQQNRHIASSQNSGQSITWNADIREWLNGQSRITDIYVRTWIWDASLPPGIRVTSKATFWSFLSSLKPFILISEWCANKSSRPLSGVTKPNPMSSLNHLTVPVVMWLLPYQKCMENSNRTIRTVWFEICWVSVKSLCSPWPATICWTAVALLCGNTHSNKVATRGRYRWLYHIRMTGRSWADRAVAVWGIKRGPKKTVNLP